jgi:thiol reductant ABC exporter CydC subunit
MYLMVAVVGVRAFALGRAGFRYGERIALHNAAFGASAKLRPQLFKKLIPFAPGLLGDISKGGFVSKVVSDVDEIQNRIVRLIGPAVQVTAVVVGGALLSLWLVPLAGVALLLLSLLAIFGILPLSSRVAAEASSRVSELKGQLAALSISTYDAYSSLAAFGWLDSRLERMRKLTERINATESKIAVSVAIGSGLVSFSSGVSVLISTFVASREFDSGQLAGVSVAVVALIPMAVFEVIQANAAIFTVRDKVKASQNHINNLLSLRATGPLKVVSGIESLPELKSIELIDAQFSYSSGVPIVSGFNLKLSAGSATALVGPSGSGKTSVAYGLLRFIEPTSGNYLINSRSAAEFDADSIRHKIGYIEQSVNILLGSVRDNLLLAKPGAADEELWQVLASVRLAETFEAREGLDTQLGERGSLISAGEAQRIGLARAVLAAFDCLILDEPTSNLDAATAEKLMDDVFDFAESNRRSIVLITHDYELAQRCETVIELPLKAI